jgi:micrococcal nuclease
VNRPQAYAPPASTNGWNYRTSGAPPPTYTLPPPTVARYQPPPYQFPPGSQQLAGTPITPPATPLPPAPSSAPSYPPPASTLSAPPSQWVSIPPQSQSAPDAAGQMFAAAAPPVIAGAAAAASQASAPPAMVAVPQSLPLQPVSTTPQSPAGRSANTHLWRVVGVNDGDTITCLDENNQQQKVRLAEMDAPELGQDFGKVSRDALAGTVFGKTVQVVDEGKDRYGRWIGHISIDGTDVNRQMIATGNAWHYAAYSNDKSLATLQSQAQAQRSGLWAQPNPTPPWEFRQNAAK